MNIVKLIEKITNAAAGYPQCTFENEKCFYTCINPYSYHIIRRHQDLYLAMNGIFVDGILMCVLIKLLWNKKIPRLSFDMTAMAADLFQYLNDKNIGKTIYFIGSKHDEIKKSVANIQAAYPYLKISGYRHGYFTDEEEREGCIKHIVSLNPDFVVVGMGSPLQERFALDLKTFGYGGIVFTCGGFLHQTSLGIRYYPEWVDKLNLRGFYRVFHEKGIPKRLFNTLIQFPILFICDTIVSRVCLNRKN